VRPETLANWEAEVPWNQTKIPKLMDFYTTNMRKKKVSNIGPILVQTIISEINLGKL
jgi:hypothetical protein